MKDFEKINPEQLNENVFKLIGKDWMLITAGEFADNNFNFMTASWGTMGVLWHKPVAMCFVRPTRHTFGFLEKADMFTLSFFDNSYRQALEYAGRVSGRDVNKLENTGLSATKTSNNSVSFLEARIIMECRKLYYTDINPKIFVDPKIEEVYPLKDYHRMYVGEIISCYKKNESK